jgi:hypothetical protein
VIVDDGAEDEEEQLLVVRLWRPGHGVKVIKRR